MKYVYACFLCAKRLIDTIVFYLPNPNFFLPLSALCSGLFERGAKSAAAVVGTGMSINSVLKGCKIQQTIKSCILEA